MLCMIMQILIIKLSFFIFITDDGIEEESKREDHGTACLYQTKKNNRLCLSWVSRNLTYVR